MKKLTIIFILFIIFANSFNLSYIFISTFFLDENKIKDIAWKEMKEEEKESLEKSWDGVKVKLIKIDKIKDIDLNDSDISFNYNISVLNGGYLVKVPFSIKENKVNEKYTMYINPFTKKIAGYSKNRED
ncbi:MAG: hypothetical protein ABF289_20650 [Clostridiales bacterium]